MNHSFFYKIFKTPRIRAISYLIILTFLYHSCKEETIYEPGRTRLKQKLEFDYKTSEIPKTTWEYHYDRFHRLEKVTQNDWFEEKYFYDEDNTLENKKTYYYANDSLGWLLNDSTVYRYSNGNLTEELKYSQFYFYRNVYEYDDSNLKTKINYIDGNISQITRYEFSNGLCLKEIINNGNIDVQLITHQYSEQKLIKSEMYQINPHFSTNKLLQQINYTYDENGDLKLEESIQIEPELVKDFSYIFVYKYEAYYE